MKYRKSTDETEREGESKRRPKTSDSEGSRSRARSDPVSDLHRSVGNQAVQAASRDGGTTGERTADGGTARTAGGGVGTVLRRPDGSGGGARTGAEGESQVEGAGGMCDRCKQRAAEGKPLNCPECEAKLQGGGAGGQTPAMRRLPDGRAVQASLAVSEPDDPHEREAERVADEVMRMDAGGVTSGGTTGVARAIDRQVAPMQCEQCEEEAQRKPLSTVRRQEGEETATTGGAEDRIQSVTGSGGQNLPDESRSFFESRFGADFSDVSVHTGSKADEAARSIDAEAFTVGSDIAFRSGAYDPSSQSGKHLLAHELTHVVQQTGAGGGGGAGGAATESGSADRAVDRVRVGSGPTAVQRKCKGGTWDFDVDGCSVPTWGNDISTLDDRNRPMAESHPEVVFGTENEGDDLPCNNHDKCYQTCAEGTTVDENGEWTYDYDKKAECDQQMYDEMMQVCEEKGNPTEEGFGGAGAYVPGDQSVSCEDWAWRYYQGLDTGGGSAFRKRQRQACECERGVDGEDPGLLGKAGNIAGDLGGKAEKTAGEAAEELGDAVGSLW